LAARSGRSASLSLGKSLMIMRSPVVLWVACRSPCAGGGVTLASCIPGAPALHCELRKRWRARWHPSTSNHSTSCQHQGGRHPPETRCSRLPHTAPAVCSTFLASPCAAAGGARQCRMPDHRAPCKPARGRVGSETAPGHCTGQAGDAMHVHTHIFLILDARSQAGQWAANLARLLNTV